MGQGLGMSRARSAITGAPVRADDVAHNDTGPFECSGCAVPVVHVGDYWTHKEDPDLARHVHALFRLARGKENSHGENCPYTPAGQVNILVDAAASVEDSINPFERAGDDGLFVFRLNIPAEEVRREDPATALTSKVAYAQRFERVWTGRRIASFCRSAVGLARIWQALESLQAQADLRKRVRIDLNGKRVEWNQFFFSFQDMGRFAETLEGSRPRHPMAVLLCIKEVQDGKIIFTDIKTSDTKNSDRVSVVAYVHPDAVGAYLPGRHYILFGDFRHVKNNEWRIPNSDESILFHNIKINLYRRSQMELVDVVDPMHD